MRHYTICIDCQEEKPSLFNWTIGEINSDLVALCECSKGHKSVSGLMHELFDVLYSSAVDSFIKGCFSESVMSFAASLERTYEMFIKVTLVREGLSFDSIDKFWKEIKNQSERQYGAFCLQYLKVTEKEWRIDSNQMSFRNNVVHKGYIATSEEVTVYADYITNCLFDILKILHDDFSEESSKLYFNQKVKTREATQKIMKANNAKFSAASHPSLLKWNHKEMIDVTFKNALQTMKEINQKFER